jgi:hypothetical protein
MHEISLEHMRDAHGFSHKSHIVKHLVKEHPDMLEPPPFTFKITTMYKDCLSRQIGEALRIYYSKDNILNSKSEYLDNCISRLAIEETPWERREREKQDDEQENLEKQEVERFKMKVKRLTEEADGAHLQSSNHGGDHPGALDLLKPAMKKETMFMERDLHGEVVIILIAMLVIMKEM